MKKVKREAVVAFIPVLHKGYLDFLRQQGGDIWVFGPEITGQFVHLSRDIRAIGQGDLIFALKTLLPGRNIYILDKRNFSFSKYNRIIMPDDEVCREFAKKYIKNKEVEFVSVFLRWNRVITFKEFEVSPDRIISRGLFHKKMIEKAFLESQKSSDWWRQIGALVVKGKKIIYSSHNHHLPTDFHLSVNGDPRSNFDAGQHQDIFTSIHAEAELIAIAAKNGTSLKGTSLYTTTFPCPNCARLIGTSGIKTVYYSKGYSLLDAEKILAHFKVKIVLVE